MSAPSAGFKSYFFSCGRAMFGVAAFFWVYGLVISIWISWVAGSRHMTSQHDRATLEGMVIGVRQVVGFSLNQDNSINLESSGVAISQLLASLGPFIVLIWLVATAAGLFGLWVRAWASGLFGHGPERHWTCIGLVLDLYWTCARLTR